MPEIEHDAPTVPRLFAAAVAADPTRPLITYYDGQTGERTELSATTLDNWVAKTANLLVDGTGLGPGDTAALGLPPHWQTAAVLLGCFATGVAVTATAGAGEIAFVALDRVGDIWSAADRYVLGLSPMAAPLREVPAGWADYVTEVRAFGDRFVAATPPGPQTLAFADRGMTHAAACAAARERARAARLRAGDRLLLDTRALPDPVDWLLAPLAAGASTVLCHRCDPATRQRIGVEERVSR